MRALVHFFSISEHRKQRLPPTLRGAPWLQYLDLTANRLKDLDPRILALAGEPSCAPLVYPIAA
jgi:hypothetical protein